MFATEDPATFWLELTNFALAGVCLLCVAVAVVGVVRDLRERRQRRIEQIVALDPRAFAVPRLGITMADGGEAVEARRPPEGPQP